MTKTLVRVDITPNPCSNEVRIASGRTFPGIRGDWTGVDMDWNTGKARSGQPIENVPCRAWVTGRGYVYFTYREA